MLKNSNAFSGFSVNDIKKAKTFYQETLGLNVRNNSMGLIELHIEGGNKNLGISKDRPRPRYLYHLRLPS